MLSKETTPEKAHLKIPFVKTEIYWEKKRKRTKLRLFLDKNYSHSVHVVIFYFILK